MRPILAILILIYLFTADGSGSVHKCVHSSTKLAKTGGGDTETSCMGCNPALPTCSAGCQSLINKLYYNCDGVCLPNGYYFDPQWDLPGCWSDNLKEVKIKVERCGCNAAFGSIRPSPSTAFILVIVASVFYLML